MSLLRQIGAGLALLLALSGAARAVEPSEMLDDPALEARAREISKGLRCLVCRNENIDESDAALAHDLRVLLRDRLLAGDSDEEAVDFIVDRYGEYVLLQPRATGTNWLLWAAGPLMLLLAAGGAIVYLRRRAAASGEPERALSAEEQERLRRILEN